MSRFRNFYGFSGKCNLTTLVLYLSSKCRWHWCSKAQWGVSFTHFCTLESLRVLEQEV